MKCNLCKKIYNNKEEIGYLTGDGVLHGIYKNNNNYYLYMPASDPYCSPDPLQIKYCPVCGKKLSNMED